MLNLPSTVTAMLRYIEGIHTLSAQATESMENVRKQASRFINARSAEELVFVRGTTGGH
ncbi:bifunctional cysteine desulfurase/selenocysteine lyase [Salmonella enterica subsp. enterica]|uniref:Bifunctional cysteine desulfurase/selenocysteine lyase n=1 Tax=Salmonella enterica I TaxID=59201 RepID=A0A379WUH2_SALET|nr:bifunctional cysteine desulfurase/selenocysteine lyase [Salmonella enterica subsp. enterica]